MVTQIVGRRKIARRPAHPSRRGRLVADWVVDIATKHPAVTKGDAEVELLDLVDFDLPPLDEPRPAMFGRYTNAHTRRWSETVAAFDGFVFVTPEYNQSAPASLKNALDYLFHEWANKPAAFVSYGVDGGVRAVEQLRQATSVLGMTNLDADVALSLRTDFEITDPEHPGTFSPASQHEPATNMMLDELIADPTNFAPTGTPPRPRSVPRKCRPRRSEAVAGMGECALADPGATGMIDETLLVG